MDIALEPGKYVVAVSGGVDSVSLLHLLQDLPDVKLVVAHFDHGIREDSAQDRKFVQTLAEQYGLPFVYDEVQLGPGASEATAREARYNFLHKVRNASNARAIITAHHQDDALETAIINLMRGSGRKGLTALGTQAGVERPMLHTSKHEIKQYAHDRKLDWREDSTNADQAYLRNYVRHQILTRFGEKDRQQLWDIITKTKKVNAEVDTLLVNQLHFQSKTGRLERMWFINLSHALAREVLAAWLRAAGIRAFDSKGLERLVVAAKTACPNSNFDVINGRVMKVNRDYLALVPAERWAKKRNNGIMNVHGQKTTSLQP